MKISPSESVILDVLWRAGRPMMSDEVAQALGEDQGWSRGTVRTFLTRLVRKQAVAAQSDGRRLSYQPLVDRRDYAVSESRTLLDRLFDGQIVPFVTQFANRKDLTQAEIAQLKALIERLDDDQ